MINIHVVSESNLWNKKIKKPEIFFNSLAQGFPKKYRFIKKKVSFTILLSNNKNIKKLNKRFRNKNKATDVLSFPLSKKITIAKKTYIGDIIISYNFIDKPKIQPLRAFKEKAIKTFIHGFLHLLGFDHIKDSDYKKMLKEEENIYQSVISKIN